MTIGLFNNLFEPYARGGAEIITRRLAEELSLAGENIFLITTRPTGAAAKLDQEKQTAADSKFPIYYLDSHFYNLAEHNSAWRLAWQINNLFSLSKRRQIKKILQAEKPEIVITHNLMGLGGLTTRLLKKLKIKQRHYLHDLQLLHPSGLMFFGQEKKISAWPAKIYQRLTRFLYDSPEKIISPSAWLLEEHRRRGFFKNSAKEVKPFNQLSNLDNSTPNISQAPNRRLNEARTFLFVGQIETHKGIFLLINAFQQLPGSKFQLLIVGDGHKLAEAKHAAASDERIKFLGRLAEADLKNILIQADCLVVPSLCYENSPTIIYAAQAAGRTVIATALGGIPEIVRDKNYLFTPRSAADLLAKLQAFLENKR